MLATRGRSSPSAAVQGSITIIFSERPRAHAHCNRRCPSSIQLQLRRRIILGGHIVNRRAEKRKIHFGQKQ